MTSSSKIALTEIVPEPLTSLDEPTPSSKPWKHDWVIRAASKTQKYSAYCFTAFLGIHLCSVAVVPALPIPVEIKHQVFEMARAVYQGIPLFESIAVVGAVIVHVASGIVLRCKRPGISARTPIVSESDPRIGLGGITGVVGLGYKKSIISTLIPSLSPLALSGYLLLPLLAYHYYKFRLAPSLVDGDSSLLTLAYVPAYLARRFNPSALYGLVLVGNYHFVTGLWRYNGKFSWNWKVFGYVCIISGSAIAYLGANSMRLDLDGFLGRRFTAYLDYGW